MSLTAPQKPLPEFHFVNRGSVPWWRAGKGFQADIVPIAMQEPPTGVLDSGYSTSGSEKEEKKALKEEKALLALKNKKDKEEKKAFKREWADARRENYARQDRELREENALIALKNKKDKAEAKKLAARERADERTKARKDRAEARR